MKLLFVHIEPAMKMNKNVAESFGTSKRVTVFWIIILLARNAITSQSFYPLVTLRRRNSEILKKD